MFQPFNESFVQSTVEATLDRHIGETEAERVLREGKSYQSSKLVAQMSKLLNTLRGLVHRGSRVNTNSHAATMVRPSTTP